MPLTLALGIELPQGAISEPERLQIETRVFDGEGRRELLLDRREEAIARRSPAGSEPVDLLSTVRLSPGR